MKNLNLILAYLLVCINYSSLLAQNPNNIYSFNIKKIGGQIEITRPLFLNDFNKNGYNNQPFFKNEKTIYLTSQRKGSKQTDIYFLDLYRRTKAQVTNTPESEYSPQLRPGTVAFNCVRVEADGKTQRLWQFPTNQSNQGKPLFPEVKNVGYYHWLDNDQVALFLVGEPHSLAIGDTRDNSITNITSNIGRGMASAPDGDLLFIQKLSESTWYIKKLNLETGKSSIITETKKGSEDFILLDDTILMAQGAKLYSYPLSGGKLWTEVADLSMIGLQNITRLSYNGRQVLVLVDSINNDQ